MSKFCKSCKVEKPLSEYYKTKQTNKSGIAYYPKSVCKTCHKKSTLKHSQKIETKKKRKLNDSKPEVKKRLRERMIKHNKEYYNSGKLKEWRFKKRKTDPTFKIKANLRCRLSYALKSNKKAASTMVLVGCSAKQVRRWIESQFTNDMEWENIEIDHMMPCAHPY